jgi:Fur family ferric uptake transcriptional regulator
MADPSAIISALERNDHRATEPRLAVARLIADQPGHFTAADVVREARIRGYGIGRATVFRALELFSQIGLIARVDLPHGAHAYVACTPYHHHHVICSDCGRAAEIDDAGLRSVVRTIAQRTGFRVDEHRLELFGLCPDCLASNQHRTERPT